MLLLMMVGMLCVTGRLVYIQILGTENFSKHHINLIKKAVQQRQQQVVLQSGRGDITDRQHHSLIHYDTYALVAFPFAIKSLTPQQLTQVADMLGLSGEQLQNILREVKEPQVLKHNQRLLELTEQEASTTNELGINGFIAVPYQQRFTSEDRLAQHLIGDVGENSPMIQTEYAKELAQGRLRLDSQVGIMGLEKTFQPFLLGNGPTTLSYYVDAHGDPIKGMDIKYYGQDNPFYPLSIQTTIDRALQTELESTLNQHGIEEGAAIVLDNRTNEILAMSSRPVYTPDVFSPVSRENKALKRYAPGSVFKIVTAAAALEERIVKPQQMFECDGTLEGTQFHCWKEEGHGRISFEEAFAQSCNIVFGQLAQQIGPEKLQNYAEKLGLLQLNGWQGSVYDYHQFKQLDHEEVGQVFATNRKDDVRHDEAFLRQTGIGQLDVQVTPLAVANMMATISKGGNKRQVTAVQDILYNTGAHFYDFKQQPLGGDQISPYTAYRLRQLLARVVTHGTASAIHHERWDVGGKTGTAQISGGRNHQWFAGYYPATRPRYSIVVLTLDQPANTQNRSLPIFSDIVDWLYDNR